ncbi:hypothetical protein [Paraburkholderia strydomiana]|uniref:hypothetical protein n=1 Tax=Paraburkholderia strydomiana TaxID=1245417 RepID=UPI0038BC667B
MGFVDLFNGVVSTAVPTFVVFAVVYGLTDLFAENRDWPWWGLPAVLVVALVVRLILPDGWHVLKDLFGVYDVPSWEDLRTAASPDDHWVFVKAQFWAAAAGIAGGFFGMAALRK